MLGEPRLFEAVRAIIDTCMEARMVREASMVLKQVMKRYEHTHRPTTISRDVRQRIAKHL
jgi:hypothetical protein